MDEGEKVGAEHQQFVYYGTDMTVGPPQHLYQNIQRISNFYPVLPYVNITVGLPYNRGPYLDCCGANLRCMLDTGCAKTSMDKAIYEFLMASFNQSYNDMTKSDVEVMGCTGETKTIEGTCKIRIYLSKSPPVYRDIVAMVVENLSEDILFGYNLLLSLIHI